MVSGKWWDGLLKILAGDCWWYNMVVGIVWDNKFIRIQKLVSIYFPSSKVWCNPSGSQFQEFVVWQGMVLVYLLSSSELRFCFLCWCSIPTLEIPLSFDGWIWHQAANNCRLSASNWKSHQNIGMELFGGRANSIRRICLNVVNCCSM